MMARPMPTILRNILACLAGIIIGSLVNGAVITAGASIVPPPAGVNVNDADSIAANIHLYKPQHFASPFLAHALGTLVGAAIAVALSARRRMTPALVVGSVFLVFGIAMCFMIPAPAWFITLDLVVAYIPMAWLGGTLARSRATTQPPK